MDEVTAARSIHRLTLAIGQRLRAFCGLACSPVSLAVALEHAALLEACDEVGISRAAFAMKPADYPRTLPQWPQLERVYHAVVESLALALRAGGDDGWWADVNAPLPQGAPVPDRDRAVGAFVDHFRPTRPWGEHAERLGLLDQFRSGASGALCFAFPSAAVPASLDEYVHVFAGSGALGVHVADKALASVVMSVGCEAAARALLPSLPDMTAFGERVGVKPEVGDSQLSLTASLGAHQGGASFISRGSRGDDGEGGERGTRGRKRGRGRGRGGGWGGASRASAAVATAARGEEGVSFPAPAKRRRPPNKAKAATAGVAATLQQGHGQPLQLSLLGGRGTSTMATSAAKGPVGWARQSHVLVQDTSLLGSKSGAGAGAVRGGAGGGGEAEVFLEDDSGEDEDGGEEDEEWAPPPPEGDDAAAARASGGEHEDEGGGSAGGDQIVEDQ